MGLRIAISNDFFMAVIFRTRYFSIGFLQLQHQCNIKQMMVRDVAECIENSKDAKLSLGVSLRLLIEQVLTRGAFLKVQGVSPKERKGAPEEREGLDDISRSWIG